MKGYPPQRLILEKRYLSFMTWEEIGRDFNYSDRWVREQHKQALEIVQGILDQSGIPAEKKSG